MIRRLLPLPWIVWWQPPRKSKGEGIVKVTGRLTRRGAVRRATYLNGWSMTPGWFFAERRDGSGRVDP